MEKAAWRIEAHLWFHNFDEYAERENGLRELLGKLHGNGSVTVFFLATPEYVEIPGASYDPMDEGQVESLMSFCGRDNVDFVARVSRDAGRGLGCLRRGRRQDE